MVLTTEQMDRYVRFICSTGRLPPTEDATELVRRQAFAENSIAWRLRRAIELTRLDIENRYGK
jgi:hypothetical protein